MNRDYRGSTGGGREMTFSGEARREYIGRIRRQEAHTRALLITAVDGPAKVKISISEIIRRIEVSLVVYAW